MAKPVVTQQEKDYILSGLELSIASCKRLAARQGQLPFAVDGYRKEADVITAVKVKVASWDVS